MEAALNACRRIVGSASFQAQAGLFLKQHCEIFDLDLDASSNKLEYTSLHEQYVEFIDSELTAALHEKLGPTFDMSAFLDAIPEHVRTREGTATPALAETAIAVDVTDAAERDELDRPAEVPQTLDVLQRFTSFESFKAAMLATKRAKLEERRVIAEAQAKYFAVLDAPHRPKRNTQPSRIGAGHNP